MATPATVTVENKTKETEQQQNNSGNCNVCMSIPRAVRYDDIYRMDEIKTFHIMFYRLYRGVAKYIVAGDTFSPFE